MTLKDREGGNASGFHTSMDEGLSVITVALELKVLLLIYDRLIAVLRESCDDEVDLLSASLTMLSSRCREALENSVEDKEGREMMTQMRSELRQFPQTLRSLLPGIGPRWCESLENQLGIQFAKF